MFLNLCKDEVWGVRKACADVFTDVSYASIQSTRREKLTPPFLLLLNDPSRWVRQLIITHVHVQYCKKLVQLTRACKLKQYLSCVFCDVLSTPSQLDCVSASQFPKIVCALVCLSSSSLVDLNRLCSVYHFLLNSGGAVAQAHKLHSTDI